MRECDLVIVGASLEALFLVSRLSEDVLKARMTFSVWHFPPLLSLRLFLAFLFLQRTLVVDTHGSWLFTWKERCAALNITHLRTPVTLHPHSSPGAFMDYIAKRNAGHQTIPSPDGAKAEAFPSVELFHSFCKRTILKKLPKDILVKGTVASVQPISSTLKCPEDDCDGSLTHQAAPTHLVCRVVCHSPEKSLSPSNLFQNSQKEEEDASHSFFLRTKALVYTASCTTPIVPSCVKAMANMQSGSQARSLGPLWDDATHSPFEKRVPRHVSPRVIPWDAVDVQKDFKATTSVILVGGGCHAGHLACQALEKGCRSLTLAMAHGSCARRTPSGSQFKSGPGAFASRWHAVDVGWWGSKHLNPFRHVKDPAKRLERVRNSIKGSMLPWNASTLNAKLAGAPRHPRVVLLEKSPPEGDSFVDWVRGVEPSMVSPLSSATESEKRIDEKEDEDVVVIVACGSGYDLGQHAPLKPLIQKTSLLSSEKKKTGAVPQNPKGVSLETRKEILYKKEKETSEDDECTLLYANNDVCGGYPVLDDETLSWQGMPLFFMGRGAQVSLGPAAREFAGYRLAADRIVKALRAMKYDPLFLKESWQRSCFFCDGNQGRFLGPFPWTADGLEARRLQSSEEPLLDRVFYERGGRKDAGSPSSESRRISKQPEDRVDVSDMDPDVPLIEIQKYAFSDDGFKILIVSDLLLPPHGVSQEEEAPIKSLPQALASRDVPWEVRSALTTRSLDVWVIIAGVAAFHLHLPKLWGVILPERSKAWVDRDRGRLKIRLFKEADGPWPSLRGM